MFLLWHEVIYQLSDSWFLHPFIFYRGFCRLELLDEICVPADQKYNLHIAISVMFRSTSKYYSCEQGIELDYWTLSEVNKCLRLLLISLSFPTTIFCAILPLKPSEISIFSICWLAFSLQMDFYWVVMEFYSSMIACA